MILGKNKWSLLLATRLIVEGADVKAIIDKSNKNDLNDREEKFIKDMNINVIVNSRVVELHGNGRIESIDIENKEDKSIVNIECDSLILTVGYFPEISFVRKSKIEIDEKRNLIVNNNETSVKGIFACGSVLTRDTELFNSGEDGYNVGESVAKYLKKYLY